MTYRSRSRQRRSAPTWLAAVLVLLAAAGMVLAAGCATGVVETSVGPRPAATVQAQDAAADVLKLISDAYKAKVAEHDALNGIEPATIHAERREKLLKAATILRTAWGALGLWKEVGPVPPDLKADIVRAASAVQALGSTPKADVALAKALAMESK